MVSMWSVKVWPKMSLEEGGRVLGVVVVVILTNEDCMGSVDDNSVCYCDDSTSRRARVCTHPEPRAWDAG